MARGSPHEGNLGLGANRSSDDDKKVAPAAENNSGRKKADSVGRVLRSVYDETLREDIPDEFKDLLGKLN